MFIQIRILEIRDRVRSRICSFRNPVSPLCKSRDYGTGTARCRRVEDLEGSK